MAKGKTSVQKGNWSGSERRSEPRVFKRNVGGAKSLIVWMALLITVGGWLVFALAPISPVSSSISTQQVQTTTPTVSSKQSFLAAPEDKIKKTDEQDNDEQLQP